MHIKSWKKMSHKDEFHGSILQEDLIRVDVEVFVEVEDVDYLVEEVEDQ
jgi:hypothetical protein